MADTLVEARNVRVVFDGKLTAVDDVSFGINQGETFGLVGESGSGKTTVAKALVGLISPTAGAVRFRGQDLAGLSRSERMRFRAEAQIIFQDPLSSLSPRLRVESLLKEPLKIHGRDVRAEWPSVRELMAAVSLSATLLDKYPHQVSGGQARRIAIARALVLNPHFVVADEPTAGLDVSIQGDFLNLLADLQERYRLTYLIVSHNLNVVRKITDRVAVMYLGKIVEIGVKTSVFRAPAHPYTHALLSANPEIDPAKRRAKIVLAGDIPSPLSPPTGCRFHTRCPRAQARCSIEEPLLRPMGLAREAACHYPLVEAA
jgi:peptide/nickel transport system ATP-binding protein